MGYPGRGMIPGEKSKDFKNSIGKLVRYLEDTGMQSLPL